MENTVEIVLTIIGLSFWILFPIGMFLSVAHVDKNTDQVVRLNKLRHFPVEEKTRFKTIERDHFDWHHPVLHFKRWLHQP